MAVTFHQIPAAYSPSDNPLMYRFSSNQTGQANFSYLIEVNLNAVLIFEARIFPETGIYAHFDASEIVRYKIPKPTLSSVFAVDNGTLQDLNIKVTENYGTPPVDAGTATSSTTRTWKARLSDEDFLIKDFDVDYVEKLYLTNVPRGNRIQVLRGQDVYLEEIVDVSAQVQMSFYNSAGTLLDTYAQIEVFGIWQLNLNSTILDPLIAASIADVAYYTVRIGLFSETFTFEFCDDYCNYPFSLQWLNEYGAYDQFIFKHNNELNNSVKSSSYRKQFGSWVGNSFVYSVITDGQIDFIKNIEQQGVLTTDYLTEAVQNYLVELFDSPFHLIYDVTGYIIAITVDNNSYKFDQQRFDELLTVEVKYTKSSNKKSLGL